ncbi:MAG: RtcB family protein [Actinomycetota bacterium]|nr:RtcB family protein [Actinomycetota bacterium]
MEEIEGGAVPVLSWAPDLEDGARRQAVNCANLAVAFHHVAVMADGHQGYGVPIGAVLALDGAISPYAVGNDIGCGMALVPTSLTREEMLSPLPGAGGRGPVARDEVMGEVQATVPAGVGRDRSGAGGGAEGGADAGADLEALLGAAFDAMEEASALCSVPLSTSQSPDPAAGKPLEREGFVARGRSQAGTLGAGNHFIELLCGPDGDVAVMLHSGSRGVGGSICNNFHRFALRYCEETGQSLPDPGLAWLPVGEGEDRWSRVGRAYERALRAGLEYAERNRRSMLEAVGDVIERRFPAAMRWDGAVNIHHNDATSETHYGRRVWVHRKGAVKAAEGTPTITPGSMGTFTYLGRGRGNPASFSSCSHGAGRVMSRSRARRELSVRAELDRIASAGGKVFAASQEDVVDEMPAAYKDLDEVMANQADLVEPVRRYTPLATYKGSEPPRRRRKKGRGGQKGQKEWRPEEER